MNLLRSTKHIFRMFYHSNGEQLTVHFNNAIVQYGFHWLDIIARLQDKNYIDQVCNQLSNPDHHLYESKYISVNNLISTYGAQNIYEHYILVYQSKAA